MIGKGKSISHLSASIQYALRREQAVILDKNIVSESPSEVAKEFKLFQQLNDRCARNSLSFVLSPTIEDGRKLSHEQLENINKSFLERMNLNNHQYIAFVHTNTMHKHIHLYVNRIDYSGKAYNDQFISNRAAHTSETIAKDMGLQTARDIQQAKYQQRQVEHPEIERIKELAKATLMQREARSVASFISLFNEAGAESGLRAEAYNNKNGNFQGLRFYSGEHKFKASQIDRSLSKQNIEHTIEHQQATEQSKPKRIRTKSR
ncbi:MAG: relaxase/mobilization nuclease domain-containing protein [Candidatus Amoebophilus sp.]